MNQTNFGLGTSTKRKHRREFLKNMDRVARWSELALLIAPFMPEGKRGNSACAVESLPRIHFMQQWFTLSDLWMQKALHDVPLFRDFAGLGGWDDRLHDESTILRFRHVLGVSADSGLIHTVVGTAAKVNDVTQSSQLLHAEDVDVFADSGNQGVPMRPGQCWALDKSRPMGEVLLQLEDVKVRIRAKVEHQFRIIERQFGYLKVKYWGLVKNTANLMTLFALSNLSVARCRADMSASEIVPMTIHKGEVPSRPLRHRIRHHAGHFNSMPAAAGVLNSTT